uniref:Uncharacterized protein n=1 Tax=Amphiprion percula TaxID=161767 RepID=A0A3P8T564_AMPPE
IKTLLLNLQVALNSRYSDQCIFCFSQESQEINKRTVCGGAVFHPVKETFMWQRGSRTERQGGGRKREKEGGQGSDPSVED